MCWQSLDQQYVGKHPHSYMACNSHNASITEQMKRPPTYKRARRHYKTLQQHYNSAAWPQQTAGLPIVSRLATCNTSQRQQLVNGMQHAPVSRASQKYTTVLPTRAKLIKIKISNEIKLNEFRLKRSDKAHKKIPAACGCNKSCTHAHTHTYTYMNVHVMSLANFRIFEFLK